MNGDFSLPVQVGRLTQNQIQQIG